MRAVHITLPRMTLPVAVMLTMASAGCSMVKAPSAMEKQVLQPPSAAFMKKVKNDPFPSASEQSYALPKATK